MRDRRPCRTWIAESRLSAMFARYYVELPIAAERVEAALAGVPDDWLPTFAGKASRRGGTLLAEVGFGDDLRVARRVAIELGRPVRMSTKTVLPLKWTAVGATSLFPSLDADLEIAPLGPGATQLSISARYVPPLGILGRAIDRALLHRVAEATLKDFLDRIAEGVLASDRAEAAEVSRGVGL